MFRKKKHNPVFGKRKPITSCDWQELEYLSTDGRIPRSGRIARPLVDESGNLEYDHVGHRWFTRPGAK